MPAAELSKLRAQISAISTQFEQPVVFVRSLLTLMELYSDRAYQPGDLTRLRILIPAYRLPALVVRQLETDLSVLTVKKPVQAQQIVDMLWKDKHFEARLMAVAMLGSLPVEPVEPVLDRLSSWINPDEEKALVTALLSSGSQRLRIEKPDQWLKLIQKWFSHENNEVKKIGLQALQEIITDSQYENFPVVFDLLQPLMLAPVFSIQRELFSLISIMAERSEVESTAFLRIIIAQTKKAEVYKFIRRCLPLLEPESRESLKSFMGNSAEE